MSEAFYFDEFQRNKAEGMRAYNRGDADEARYHFLKAAEHLLKLSALSQGKIRDVRYKNARRLIEMAKRIRAEGIPSPRAKVRAARSSETSTGTQEEETKKPSNWLVTEKPSVSFADIAGLEEVKEQIQIKMIYPFKHPEKAKKYRVRTGGGILLYGPPGTGKTLIAKAIAGELDATFFAIAPSEILNKWVGESEKNIRKLFDAARKCERAIIFLDEVVSLTPPRRDSESGGVMQRVVPQILNELDGFDKKEGHTLLFLGATNEPWNIDPAMMRPGRLDEKIYIGLPDKPARKKILEMNLKEVPIDPDVDLDKLADRLDGYSGADIAYLCRKVTEQVFEKSVEHGHEPPVAQRDFEEVLLKFRPSVNRVDIDRFRKFAAGN
jgi:transitional endoplasmic reticulum ATPase